LIGNTWRYGSIDSVTDTLIYSKYTPSQHTNHHALAEEQAATTSLLAVFLTIPFAVQSFPKIGLVFWLVLILVMGQVGWLRLKYSVSPSLFASPTGWALALVTATVAYGLFRTSGHASFEVWKDMARGVAFLIALGLLSQLETVHGEAAKPLVVEKFSNYLVAVAFICGVAGYFKYVALLAGYCTDLIAPNCPQNYPWGTSLVGDYNFFALTLLFGALATVHKWATADSLSHSLGWSAVLGVILFAGMHAGSRRFWIIAPIAIATGIALTWLRHRQRAAFNKLFQRLALGVVCSWAILEAGVWVFTMTESTSTGLMASRLHSLADQAESYGLSARLERWRYALSLIDLQTFFAGAGFSYRSAFGCHFIDCTVEDYPHLPLLSALLYGGIGAALATLACFGIVLFKAWRALNEDSRPDIGISMMICLIFISVSGDTLLSAPVFLAILLMLSFTSRSATATWLGAKTGR